MGRSSSSGHGIGRRIHEPPTVASDWTVVTRDGSPVAHAEHTIVVTQGSALVLTG